MADRSPGRPKTSDLLDEMRREFDGKLAAMTENILSAISGKVVSAPKSPAPAPVVAAVPVATKPVAKPVADDEIARIGTVSLHVSDNRYAPGESCVVIRDSRNQFKGCKDLIITKANIAHYGHVLRPEILDVVRKVFGMLDPVTHSKRLT